MKKNKMISKVSSIFILSLLPMTSLMAAEPVCLESPEALMDFMAVKAAFCSVDPDGVHPDLIPDEALDLSGVESQIKSEQAKLANSELSLEKLKASAPDYKVAVHELQARIKQGLAKYTQSLNQIQDLYSKNLSKSFSRIKALKDAAAVDGSGAFQKSLRDEQERLLKEVKPLAATANSIYQKAIQELRNLGYSDVDWKSGSAFGACASAPCVRVFKQDLQDWTDFVESMNVSLDMDKILDQGDTSRITRSKIVTPKRSSVTAAVLEYAKDRITSPVLPKNQECNLAEVAAYGLKKGVDAGLGITAAVGAMPIYLGEKLVHLGTEVAKMLDTRITNLSLDLEEADFDRSTSKRINDLEEASEELARKMPPAFFDNEYEELKKSGKLKNAREYSVERASDFIRADHASKSDHWLYSAKALGFSNKAAGATVSAQGRFVGREDEDDHLIWVADGALNAGGKTGAEGRLGVGLGFSNVSGTIQSGSHLTIGTKVLEISTMETLPGIVSAAAGFGVTPFINAGASYKGWSIDGSSTFYLSGTRTKDGVELDWSSVLDAEIHAGIPLVSFEHNSLKLFGGMRHRIQAGVRSISRFELGIGISR